MAQNEDIDEDAAGTTGDGSAAVVSPSRARRRTTALGVARRLSSLAPKPPLSKQQQLLAAHTWLVR